MIDREQALAVAQESEDRGGEARFPAAVCKALTKAGWQPGRNVSRAIDKWLAENADALRSLPLSPVARAALDEFGGLQLGLVDAAGKLVDNQRFVIYPHPLPGVVTDTSEGFIEETGIAVFPIGAHDDGPSDLVIAPDGRMYQLHWAGWFLLGDSLDAGLATLIAGGPAAAVNDDGSVSRETGQA